MGSVLTQIMQKSTTFKYLLSDTRTVTDKAKDKVTDKAKDKHQTADQPSADTSAASSGHASEVVDVGSCSYKTSHNDSISTTREFQLEGEHSESVCLSVSSMSSSAMDCITSRSNKSLLSLNKYEDKDGHLTQFTKPYNRRLKTVLSTASVNGGHRRAQIVSNALSVELPPIVPTGKIIEQPDEHLPSTSQPEAARASGISRSPTATTHYASNIHKCASEPLDSRPSVAHRTSSELPLPTRYTDCRHTRHKMVRKVVPDMDSSTKHMEGSSVQELQTLGVKQKSAYTRIELGDNQSYMQSKTSENKHGTTPESEKDGETTTATVTSSTTNSARPHEGSSKESSRDKLTHNMEYVTSVMKKKMHPQLFDANRNAFIDKILTNSHVQYGYQNQRYIKIGSGEFGEVLYGRMKHDLKLVAIKALKKDKTDNFALLQEAFLLQLASTTGFAATYKGLAPFCALGNKYLEWAIICDFIGSSDGPYPYDFRQTLRAARKSQRTIQLVMDWIFTCTKIAFAVKQFHNMGMLLNDIKADNILLRPTGTGSFDPVFVDFGLASVGEGITLALEVNDTNRAKILKEYSHIAPEVLFGGETNKASDVFSLGKALTLVSEAFPVEAFVNVISQCTLWNVSERPSIDQLIVNIQWLSRNILMRD